MFVGGVTAAEGPLHIGSWVAWPIALLGIACLLFFLVRFKRHPLDGSARSAGRHHASPYTDPMRYFFDTEFLETSDAGRSSIQLISVGLVAEDGQELYLENAQFDWAQEMDPWLRENVKHHLLGPGHPSWCTPEEMTLQIGEFVGAKPEFWAYVGAYDWVALVSLFGRLIDRPEGWPIYCHDLKQEIERRGLTKQAVPAQDNTAHFAVDDARWNLTVWRFLEAA